MSETVTAARPIRDAVLDPNERGNAYRGLTTAESAESLTWLADHGFPIPRYVFRVEYEVIDCPMVKVHWLGDGELRAIPSADLQANDDIRDYCHVSEVAVRYLPDWWQPEPAA